MSDAVSYAISRVKRAIPAQLLQEAFLPQRYDPTRKTRRFDSVLAQSLEEQIKARIIDSYIALDLATFAGTEDIIRLDMATREAYDPWNVIYRFDSRALGNRTINKVHEVLYGIQSGFGTGNYGPLHPQSSKFVHVMKEVGAATAGSPNTGTAYVELIGPNTILINDVNALMGYASVRCTLSYDDTFSEIKSVYRRDFSELAVAAAKAYIYNTLVIDVDEGVIRGGKTVGRFREVLDSYQDQLQIYDELIDGKFQKIALMNDTEAYRKIMKLQLGSKPKY